MEAVKNLVVAVMNRAVRGYIHRNKIIVVAVAGSIGKTSTTSAIRTVLGQKYQVHIPKTAYNTNRSVHLEMFDLPFATSTSGWIKMVAKVLAKSLGKAPYQVLVVEIGTDHPGELQSFAWLKPRIGVLTAIAPEHMEYFKTIEAVAKEELSITTFCDHLVFNANMVDQQYIDQNLGERLTWYGRGGEFKASNYQVEGTQVKADFELPEGRLNDLTLNVLGEHSLDALTAATAVATQLGLSQAEVSGGVQAVQAVKGRMQRLVGVEGSLIIDDSYNASPQAIKGALEVLGQLDVPQRIALLGNMNEMGEYSPQAHRDAGGYCDPQKLDLLITVGEDANNYLAATAEQRGCNVVRCQSPYEAGKVIAERLKPGAAILFKGSQNGVFAEEAIKSVLADKADEAKLVRQSDYWMTIKQKQFDQAPSQPSKVNNVDNKTL